MSQAVDPAELRSWGVLVVERDQADLQAIVSFLMAAGHRVRAADNGFEAIRAFRETCPDIVVVNRELTISDGLSVPHLLRIFDPPGRHIPTIATTEIDGQMLQPVDEQDAADALVHKPLNVAALADQVRELAARYAPIVPPGAPEAITQFNENPPAIDLPAAQARCGGDKQLLIDLIGFFFEDAFGLLAKIHQAIAHRDWDSARSVAHSLKGIVANFGATDAKRALQTLEDLKAPEPDVKALELSIDREVLLLAVALADFLESSGSAVPAVG